MEHKKRNIKMRLIELAVALVLWGLGSFYLWDSKNSKSHFVPLVVLIIIVVSCAREYNDWKKYKKENSQIKG